jgi:hypothetical protein
MLQGFEIIISPCCSEGSDRTEGIWGIYRKLQSFFTFADTNECANNTHNCHENATCLNTIGSFACVCLDGFSGDGVNCTGMRIKTSY